MKTRAIAALAAGVLMAGCGGGGATVAVRSVVHLGLRSAAQKLRDAGLCLGIRMAPTSKSGVIVRQTPSPNTRIGRRSRVTLTVGLGLSMSQARRIRVYGLNYLGHFPLAKGCPVVRVQK
jgi:beta-lactam-binding protein with PASTA domain